MSTYPVRQKLIEIALRDVGTVETSRNRATKINRYWDATNYPDGWKDRAPYCAAAVCWWVREWLRLPEVIAALGKSSLQLEKWRCKSPAAFGWEDWAKSKGLLIFDDSPKHTLHTGDLMVFDMSHIGIVKDDNTRKSTVLTIEANTGPSGGRDGDGVWEKVRPRSLARSFIRLID